MFDIQSVGYKAIFMIILNKKLNYFSIGDEIKN